MELATEWAMDALVEEAAARAGGSGLPTGGTVAMGCGAGERAALRIPVAMAPYR